MTWFFFVSFFSNTCDQYLKSGVELSAFAVALVVTLVKVLLYFVLQIIEDFSV